MEDTAGTSLQEKLSLTAQVGIGFVILICICGIGMIGLGGYEAYTNFATDSQRAIQNLISGILLGVIALGLGSLVLFSVIITESIRRNATTPNHANLD